MLLCNSNVAKKKCWQQHESGVILIHASWHFHNTCDKELTISAEIVYSSLTDIKNSIYLFVTSKQCCFSFERNCIQGTDSWRSKSKSNTQPYKQAKDSSYSIMWNKSYDSTFIFPYCLDYHHQSNNKLGNFFFCCMEIIPQVFSYWSSW